MEIPSNPDTLDTLSESYRRTLDGNYYVSDDGVTIPAQDIQAYLVRRYGILPDEAVRVLRAVEELYEHEGMYALPTSRVPEWDQLP